MKNSFKMLLAGALMAVCADASAQNAYFSTDFKGGIPAAFTLHDVDGLQPSTDMTKIGFAVGTPWIAVKVDKDSNMVACSTSWYKKAGQSNDWMVTGGIKISSDKAALTWRAKTSDADYRDGYKVYVSTTGTAVSDFSTSTAVYSTSAENHDWTEHSVSLSAYAGKKVYIAFVNDSKDKACLYVDDIFVGVPSHVGLSVSLNRVIHNYGEIAVSGKAFATGSTAVNSYTIGYRINGKTGEQHFTGTLSAGSQTDFTLDDKFAIARNETLPYTVWIKNGTDSSAVSGKVSAYPWKLVSEEITGVWCGYCVRGIVAMKTMNATYPDSFIGIAVHSSGANWVDSMSIGMTDYTNALMSKCNMSGYPHCVYNRNALYSIDPANMPDYYTGIMSNYNNTCAVQLHASYDEATNKIKTTTDMYFAADVANAAYKLVYVVVENNVHRTHADSHVGDKVTNGYDQNNYYANNAYGVMGGFESLPSPVPAEKMWFNDVARTIQPGYDGISGVVPSTIAEDDHFSYEYTLDMPATVLKKANTELVVMLLDANGCVVNADKVAITGATDGITSVNANGATDNDTYYNINGMRVEHPTKGIYIHNGRKVVM